MTHLTYRLILTYPYQPVLNVLPEQVRILGIHSALLEQVDVMVVILSVPVKWLPVAQVAVTTSRYPLLVLSTLTPSHTGTGGQYNPATKVR